MNDANRALIGKWATAVGRERVYETPDGLEVESNQGFEVTFRRVFFDDVQLVTYHRAYGAWYLVLTGLFGLGILVLALSLFLIGDEATAVAIGFVIVDIPIVIAFLLRAIYGIEVISVFGRRSKATIRFGLKKQRAREVYGKICATVRLVQRKRADEFAAAVSPEESSVPLPPDFAPPPPPEQ